MQIREIKRTFANLSVQMGKKVKENEMWNKFGIGFGLQNVC
jgi:hypothetical protein